MYLSYLYPHFSHSNPDSTSLYDAHFHLSHSVNSISAAASPQSSISSTRTAPTRPAADPAVPVSTLQRPLSPPSQC